MSFAVSARTARDPSRPDGYRVRALWNCIEFFHPFGFQATRNQLMRLTGVRNGFWTMEQVLRAVDVLERTREPWAVHAQQQLERARTAARQRPRPRGPGDGELVVDWFVLWLSEPEHAELWGVAELGDCDGCGHLRALHLRHGCLACFDDPAGLDGQPCRLPSPLDHLPPQARAASPTPARRCWRPRVVRHRRGTGRRSEP